MLLGVNSTSKGERLHMAKGGDYVRGGARAVFALQREFLRRWRCASAAPATATTSRRCLRNGSLPVRAQSFVTVEVLSPLQELVTFALIDSFAPAAALFALLALLA